MASLIFALFLLLFKMAASSAVTQSSHMTEPMCYDWGEWIQGALSVVEGGAGWLSCPLFSHPSVYNYTSTQSAGHNLVWYRLPDGEDLEQPITYSSRLSKDRERLWLQPAAAEDAGLYICMLRNKSSCSKISMRLKVVRRDEPLHSATCPPAVVTPIIHTVVPFEDGKTLDCPDLQDIIKMADKEPNVTWYHTTLTGKCDTSLFWDKNREQKGTSLQIYIMLERHQGLYSCSATYLRRGRAVSFSRSINVTAVYPLSLPKLPSILQVITVRQGSEVHLLCRALFPYLNSSWDIWWTVDGKTLDKVSKPQRFNNTIRRVMDDHGDRTEVSKLVIKDFGSDDLNREYNCSVRNSRGFETLRAQLEEEVWLPSLELGCGLGVTLVLMLLLFVVYHVFWLELLLFYRSWFGSDERHTDDKEYDVYISYARNSEDEQFVLSTLRGVLENELGYSVCIFDRDSLPGGTITDETLSFVARSRRLLVVVSPGYATQGSQALLELKAGIDGMALGGHLRVILVQYKPLQGRGWVRELRRARLALALVRWQGDKSRELTSGFWKRLRVELPVRRSSSGGEKEGALMRLYSQNSTNSQTGLISNTVKDPEKVLRCAA